MAILQEFREFAIKGNVVDLAVGVIIGTAFGKIVDSLVKNVIMPPIGYVIGGKPFEEDIIIWWNFVGRSTEEIQQAAHDWINQSRFGQVAGFEHERLTIPAIPDNLKASR